MLRNIAPEETHKAVRSHKKALRPNKRVQPTAPAGALKIGRFLKRAFPIYDVTLAGAAQLTRKSLGHPMPSYTKGHAQ
jgi:hypothetical protein